MNKNDIFKTLEKYGFDKEKILILSGAAMVVNGIKETTNDIDMAVSDDYERVILDKYKCELKEMSCDNKVYSIDGIIDFSLNYYDFGYDIKEGYKVQKPVEILKLKETLNREKDKKDIDLIQNYLALNNVNSLVLAYLGDSIYEVYIRKHLINRGIVKVNELQKEAVKYVSAKAQSAYLEKILEADILSDEEINVIKRARNHKSHGNKNTDIVTYKRSTGLEALIGYLYLKNNILRIEEIMKNIVGD